MVEKSMKTVISVERMSFSYNGISALEDVSLTVNEKDFISIVGPNAGGKTTLVKLFLGLLKPTRGSVLVFGKSPVKVRHRIGYTPQQASLDHLFPINVMDVVLTGCLGGNRLLSRYHKRDRIAAENTLNQVDMWAHRDRSFCELSGGQRQRVLIARALAASPDLLLLDEPTANVDARIETDFYELLKTLNQQMTIVMVTHDLGFVSRYVNRVACVNRRLVMHATSDITGEMINDIYNFDTQMVRHDHHCSYRGHKWFNS